MLSSSSYTYLRASPLVFCLSSIPVNSWRAHLSESASPLFRYLGEGFCMNARIRVRAFRLSASIDLSAMALEIRRSFSLSAPALRLNMARHFNRFAS